MGVPENAAGRRVYLMENYSLPAPQIFETGNWGNRVNRGEPIIMVGLAPERSEAIWARIVRISRIKE
jgi:hypothetical protein